MASTQYQDHPKRGPGAAPGAPKTARRGPGKAQKPSQTVPGAYLGRFRASQECPRRAFGATRDTPGHLQKWSPESPDPLRTSPIASGVPPRVPPSLPGTSFGVHPSYISGLPSPYFLPIYARISADTFPSVHVLSEPPTQRGGLCETH